MYDRGHVVSKSGNVSCRLQDGNILITPSRLRKKDVTREDLCVISPAGDVLTGETPSSEYRVHCAIYKVRSDVMAVVHGHSPYAIASSLATISFRYPLLPETALSLGSVPTISYAPPGSVELAEAVAQYLLEYNALILERHGVVALADNLEDAFDRLEEVEHAAKIAYLISVKGRIPVMGRAQVMHMVNFVKEQGIPVPEMAMNLLHKILAR
jgi:L-fuculose-phosphate aldolase